MGTREALPRALARLQIHDDGRYRLQLRNISSGAVIATQYFPGEVVFPVMCGTLFQQVLASLIGHLFERLTGEERAKQRKRVEAGRDAMAR